MNIKDFDKFMDNAFGDRHIKIDDNGETSSSGTDFKNDKITIPGSKLKYSQVGLDNMDVPGYINTKLKIMLHQDLYIMPKHELLRVIFEGWYIIGRDKSLGWLAVNAEGIDKAKLAIENFEDLHYGEGNNPELRTDCSNPELVAFRIAIIQGADILHRSIIYSKYKDDKEVSRELMEDLIIHTN